MIEVFLLLPHSIAPKIVKTYATKFHGINSNQIRTAQNGREKGTDKACKSFEFGLYPKNILTEEIL